ncbi:thioredoxin [Candidatus Pacearchaeota archaeon]|nr:thioredoxin [Candidatus Pacearchaeota archaeon]
MSENIFVLTEKNFDQHTSKGNWVIDFWAEWCHPCKMMEPHFKEAAEKMKGNVHFGKVDVDAQPGLQERFEVVSIPTTLFMHNGEQVNRVSGAMPKELILENVRDSF